jgi:type VI secretion system protein ImpA
MPLTSDLLEPIDKANPGGASIRYTPLFDQIKHARIEEEEIPQGEWKRERKVADYALVVKLATNALAKSSKDLQVAAWLTEALLHREGFGGLRSGLELLHQLLARFWDHLYPELDDDGDSELRAAPLEWVGGYLQDAVRSVPLNQSGHSFVDYKQSRTVGYEEDVKADASRMAARGAALEEGKLSPEEFDDGLAATPKAWYTELVQDLDGCVEALDALDLEGQERFGEYAPGYHKLRDTLQEVRQVASQLLARKLELEPDPVVPPAGPEAGDTDGAAAPPGPGVVAGDGGGDSVSIGGGSGATPAAPAAPTAASAASAAPVTTEPSNAEDAAARIAAAARYLRRENPMSPAPYLLLRSLRWGELRTTDELDPRMLETPPTETRTRLKTMLLDGEWAELLDAAEDVMATPIGRGWLDLQRYALTACEELGYDAVAEAVKDALRGLLRDRPELLDASLMDDSPAANAETRRWLVADGLAVEPDPEDESAAKPPPARPRARASRGALAEAAARLRAGDPDRAIEILMRESAHERSARERFLRRAEAARIMVDSGREAIALPILKEMIEQVDQHKLEEWEDGETIARPLSLLHRCLERLNGDQATKEALYVRICRLDPIQAMSFNSPEAAQSNDDTGG